MRRQLLLVALMALALPWAGCQYVKEMESTLRHGQLTALKATAQAVAARISSDELMLSGLNDSTYLVSPSFPELSYYAYFLNGAIALDGYSDDWRHLGFGLDTETDTQLTNNNRFQVFMGQDDDLLYLFVKVNDSQRQFYNPTEGVDWSDHLKLFVGGGGVKAFRVFSAASGQVSVEGVKEDGRWFREHKISGFWNENETSYFLELKVPLKWVERGLSIQAVDGLGGRALQTVSDSALESLVIPKRSYTDALRVFIRPGVKLLLTAPGAWILGQSGSVHEAPLVNNSKTWLYWVVRRLVGRVDLPIVTKAHLEGRLPEPLGGAPKVQQWYEDGGQVVARVSVSIDLPNGSTVSVVAEESTDSVEVLTTGAIGRLLVYSLLATALVALALLVYASILSVRIRSLSMAAQKSVDVDGRISGSFIPSNSKDEIGELSRSYSGLLGRLQSYNAYLESLSGKLSHELRTPLAIVRSSLDNLGYQGLSPQALEYLDRASVGAQRLSSILNAMGAASKVEQSIQSSELESVDIILLFRQVVAAYRGAYKTCNIHLSEPKESSFVMVVAPELVVQMLDKLVENAVDFTGQGGDVFFELLVGKEELVIRVMNTGPLLGDDMQGQIFESLVSLRSSNSGSDKEVHHLGLGLYIVRLIVSFHSGRVQAYNHQNGDKVVFEVSLPVR